MTKRKLNPTRQMTSKRARRELAKLAAGQSFGMEVRFEFYADGTAETRYSASIGGVWLVAESSWDIVVERMKELIL